jgi:carboxyl-terminal processing protease
MSNQVILVERYRGGRESALRSGDKGLLTDPNFKVVVLVNHNSASASEILAGAFRDNKRGLVMGETTFGKGTVNRFIDLPSDGGKLYVTIGQWLTPKRDLLEGRGVKPDLEVRAADNESPNDYNNAVLHRAVEFLRTGS